MLTDCRGYRVRLMELARGNAGPEERRLLMTHVERCPDCTRFFEEQAALSAALATLACEIPPEMAAIEPCVLAEFDHVGWGRPLRLPVAALLAAAAAAAAVGFFWVHRPVPAPAMRRETPPPALAMKASPAPAPPPARLQHAIERAPEVEAPFLAIPYTVPLAPEERTSIVHMDVSVAALIAAGFDVQYSDPGGLLDADVLVSQDGRARAIRFNSK
jgi:hypothetical protein